MLYTHGRDPYAGERMVLAGLAEPVTWSDVGQKLAKPAHRPQFETPTPQLGRDADTETTVDLASFLTWVARQYTEVFEMDPDLSLGFVDSGGDSVMAVELLDAANEEFDVDYSLDDFLDCDNVAEFFTEVLAHR